MPAVLENTTELLIKWLREREAIGYKRYGGPMMTFCGKDSFVEAMEEGLYLIQYLFQANLEFDKFRNLVRKGKDDEVRLLRIYIAGPYTGDGSPVAKEENTRKALMVFHELLDLGFSPYCPHLAHYADLLRTRPPSDWLNLDLEWLAVSDALFLLPGESPGARIEQAFCKTLGIPVFTELNELLKARDAHDGRGTTAPAKE